MGGAHAATASPATRPCQPRGGSAPAPPAVSPRQSPAIVIVMVVLNLSDVSLLHFACGGRYINHRRPGGGSLPPDGACRRGSAPQGGARSSAPPRGRARSALRALLPLLAALPPPPGAGASAAARVAVANVVHSDGSAEVRLFGHSAAGPAVEGLRVTSAGAEAAGLPLTPALSAAVTLVLPDIPFPPQTLEVKGGTRLWRPSVAFPALATMPAGLGLEFIAETSDASVATVVWDAAAGAFNISDASWAGAACGGGGGYVRSTALNVTVAVAGLGAAGAASAPGITLRVSCDPAAVWPAWDTHTTPFTGYSVVSAASVDGRLFVAGKNALYSGSHNYLHEYFPESGSSLYLPDPPEKRASAELVALGPGDLLYIGGQEDNAQLFLVHRWREGRGWAAITSMLSPRCCGFAAAKIGDKVYVAGGYSGGAANSAEVLDTATWTWSQLPNMPLALYGTSGAVFEGRLHVVGGNGNSGRSGDHMVFDPAANEGAGAWSQLTGLPSTRRRMSGSLVAAGGTLYLVGGESDWVDRWDPDTDAWSASALLPRTVNKAGVTLHNDQIVGVGGAQYGQGTTVSVVGDLHLGA